MAWEKTNEKIIKDLVTHLKLGKPLADKRKKPIGEMTARKYNIWLNKLSEWFGKDFNKLNEVDIDTFRNKLRNDGFRQRNGKPYKPNTKSDLEVKILRTLLNFLHKDELARFSSNYEEILEIPSLTKTEVEKMIKHAKLRDKLILQMLFDGGFRANEFLNVRYCDVYDDNLLSDGYYKVRIIKSKTKPRTVGLTLPLSTELIKEWLQENSHKIGTSEKLVPLSYMHLNKVVARNGSCIKKKITPHVLRHSSATYFCHYLSHYQLCKRYGWAMASDMPQRYIDTEGVDDNKINNEMVAQEGNEFRKELNQFREELNRKNEQVEALVQQQQKMQERLLATNVLEIATKKIRKKK